MAALGILAAWLALALIGALGTLWWALRLWRRRRELPAPEKIVVGVLSVTAVVGGLGTLIGLVKGFGAVGGESVDPSQKARILGEGISTAMNYTALGIAVWLPSVLVLTIYRRKTRRPTK